MVRALLLLGCACAAIAVAAGPGGVPESEAEPPTARATDEGVPLGPTLVGLPAPRPEARSACAPAGPVARVTCDLRAEQAPADDDGADADVECDADVEPGPGPADPVEQGPCRLTLRFVSEGDEQAVTPRARLWRLGAPGNADWTWGDQEMGQGGWKGGALVFERLPIGRYRVQALGARRGSEDPPPFDVLDPQTDVRLVIPMPPRHRVFLVALDQNGVRLTRGRRTFLGSSRHGTEERPTWRQPRKRRAPEELRFEGLSCWRSCACGGSRRDDDGTPLEGGDAGFEIGAFSEPSRGESSSHSLRFHDRDRSLIHVHVAADEDGPPGDRTYLGISVPLSLLASRILLPGGRLALDAGARVSARSTAIRLTPDTGPFAWRTLPIQVSVTLAGYEDLTFEIDLDGRMARWTMKPRAPDAGASQASERAFK